MKAKWIRVENGKGTWIWVEISVGNIDMSRDMSWRYKTNYKNFESFRINTDSRVYDKTCIMSIKNIIVSLLDICPFIYATSFCRIPLMITACISVSLKKKHCLTWAMTREIIFFLNINSFREHNYIVLRHIYNVKM